MNDTAGAARTGTAPVGFPGQLREELFRDGGRGIDAVLSFLQSEGYDGLLYWNLLDPDDAWVSDGFASLLGYEVEDIDHVARWWRRRVVRADLGPTIEAVERTAADPSVPFDRVVRYHHRDGRVVHVRARGVVLHDEDGRAHRLLGLHTDVSDLVATEEALLRVNDTLRQFSATIAHDLKNPLTAVAGLLSLLQQAEDGTVDLAVEQRRDIVARALAGTQRATRMILELSAFATQASGELARRPVDLGLVVRDAVATVRDTEHGRDAELVVPDGLPVVWGDRAALEHVVLNLLDNACKYARPGTSPSVRVDAQPAGDLVDLIVRDDGVGIPAGERERVFALGARVPEAEEVASGYGIGLAAVRVLLAQLGGTIRAEPGDGDHGTTMRVRLLRAPA